MSSPRPDFASMKVLFGLAIFVASYYYLEAKFLQPISEDPEECFLPALLQSSPQNIHLICAESSYCPSDIINTVTGVAWTFYDREEPIIVAYEWQDVCILAADDIAMMANLLRRSVECNKTRIILTFPTNIRSEDMKALFDIAWSVGIVDVVISKRADELFCEYYTYIPFRSGKCYDTSPVLLDKRHKAAEHVNKTLFPPEKVSALHLCELRVHYDLLARMPSSKAVAMRWHRFASFLLKAMNADDKPMPLHHSAYTIDKDKKSGIGVGMFLLTAERTELYVFTPIRKAIVTGICLQKMPVLSVQWLRIFYEFSFQVWCCILVIFIATVCYVYVVFSEKWPLSRVLLLCYQTLLNVCSHFHVARAKDRLFLSLWLFVCLVLNSAYQSRLASDLTLRVSRDAIENVADFLQSDVTLVLPEEHLRSLKAFVWNSPERRPLVEKAKGSKKTYYELIRPVDKVAYVCGVDDMDGPLMSYRMLPDSTFVVFRTYFVIQKPTPLEKILLKSVLRIFDAGAFVYVHLDNMHRTSPNKRGGAAVATDFGSLSAVFLLWICGCFVAFLVFSIEVVMGRKS